MSEFTASTPTAPARRIAPAPAQAGQPASPARDAQRGEKITMLTAYDATFAAVADSAGVDAAGRRLARHGLPGPLEHGRRHARDHVLPHRERHARPAPRPGHGLVVADLPFGSYHESRERAIRSASALMHAGAHGRNSRAAAGPPRPWPSWSARHPGLRPPRPDASDRMRSAATACRGRSESDAQRLKRDALALQDAGADMVVLEMVPAAHWRRADRRAAALPHDRHRFRRRHRWPGCS